MLNQIDWMRFRNPAHDRLKLSFIRGSQMRTTSTIYFIDKRTTIMLHIELIVVKQNNRNTDIIRTQYLKLFTIEPLTLPLSLFISH